MLRALFVLVAVALVALALVDWKPEERAAGPTARATEKADAPAVGAQREGHREGARGGPPTAPTVASISLAEFLPNATAMAGIPPAQRTIALPDGTTVPVINRAFGAPDMVGAWPEDRPWSSIVRIDTDSHGDQWYVHADESRSQTVVREVRRGGESAYQPMTLVYAPVGDDVPTRGEADAVGNGRGAAEANEDGTSGR